MKPAPAALLLAILAPWIAAPAGFRTPVALGELTGTADAIVVGTVRQVKAESFSLEVHETLRGEAGRGRLVIEKLRPDAENPRWTAYRTGQELLLFLWRTKGAAGRSCWRIGGFIGEGEIPLDQAYAYFPGRYFDFLAPASYEVHGAKPYLQRIGRATLLDALRGYGRCFAWETRDSGPRPRIVCTESDLAAYRSRSPLHDFLVREAGTAP